jgi:hypothetical protein
MADDPIIPSKISLPIPGGGVAEVVVPVVKPTAPAQVGDKNIAPNTTAADDLRTEGQRWTNRLWESVQAYIAGTVVTTALVINGIIAFLSVHPEATKDQISSANNASQNINILASLIIGFYFGRVNHQKESSSGGVQKGDIGR